MSQKELEFTEEMLARSDVMDNAVYTMCLAFIQYENDEEKFPWDICLLSEIREFTIKILREKGYPVCDPCIIRGKTDRYCSLEECKLENCTLHP